MSSRSPYNESKAPVSSSMLSEHSSQFLSERSRENNNNDNNETATPSHLSTVIWLAAYI